MSETIACPICAKHKADFAVSGSSVYHDELLYAGHAYPEPGQEAVYLGWLVLEPLRHLPGLADLGEGEARGLGFLAARLSRALKDILNAEHIYAFVIGHAVPHLHLHLVARYPDTPREYWGTRVDEWPDAPMGDAQAVAGLCERLRDHLAGEWIAQSFGEVIGVEIEALRPNNWYLNAEKLSRARQAWAEGRGDALPPVLVTEIDGQLSLIDGHSRTFAAYEAGAQTIQAEMEKLENIEGSSALYRHIHRRGSAVGVERIADLKERILSPDEHRRLWTGYCQDWLEMNPERVLGET